MTSPQLCDLPVIHQSRVGGPAQYANNFRKVLLGKSFEGGGPKVSPVIMDRLSDMEGKGPKIK